MEKRVLILGNCSLVVFGMRGELIQRLVQEGWDVVVSFPTDTLGEEENPSERYGCTYIKTSVDRRGTNVFRDLTLLWNYIKLLKGMRVDVVLTYTVKCNIYGGIACRLLKIPYIANITGLGKGLAEGGIRQKILVLLYRLALKSAECVFFQNQSDLQFFVDSRIRSPKDALLPGSGVNLDSFASMPYPSDDKIVFTYIARIMKEKGIDQFLEAAKAIKLEYPGTEFHICGFYEDDYKRIIESAEKQNLIQYKGQVKDVRSYIANSHCIVLPTYHPEGVSNVLLEAAACARPIITTNRPGCREVVDDGVNGFFVKEKDSQDLIRVMQRFMSLTWEERRDMGLAGRVKVEREFDRQIVVKKYMEQIEC